MDRSAKAKTSLRQRLLDADKRGKAASGTSGHKPASRVLPRPANDTGAEPQQMAEPSETGEMGVEALELGAESIGELGGEESLIGFEEGGLPGDDEVEVTVVTSAKLHEEDDVVVADAPAGAEPSDNELEEEETGAPVVAASKSDEPQSFLAMYFRDMAELDVLRPEQEFDTARQIEQMELDLWRSVLSFVPTASWVADLVEAAATPQPVPAMNVYRPAAEKAKPRLAIKARSQFEALVVDVAAEVKELDMDRIFIDAVSSEMRKLATAARGAPHLDPLPAFATTKPFLDLASSVATKVYRIKIAKNEFVKANLRLVVSIARRFNHGRLPLPDLIQEGNIGLMKAVERYDYRRGFRFSTYASWWIRHAISRALADKGRAVRLPVHMIDAYHKIAKSERELQAKLERPATTAEIAQATGIEPDKLEKMKTFLAETPISLDKPISDDDGRRLIDVLVDPNEEPAPPDQMENAETQQDMLKLLQGLKPIEADILRKRFGLVSDRERTLKEIGDEYHLSRERVRQLQEQALAKMRRAMSKIESL